jgi:hypothetical protein
MLLFMLLALSESKDCPKYKCKSDDQHFNSDTCVYFKNTTEGKYYARECPSDGPNTYCDLKIGSNSTCIPKPIVFRYPGEDCDDEKHPCYKGSICMESECIANSNGTCTSDYDCNVTQFCNISICTDQTDNPSITCKNDYICKNTHGCNGTDEKPGKCLKYFSVPDYEIVASCKDNINYLCSTGHCIYHKGKNRCFGSAMNRKPYPYTCDSSVCKSHVDENLDDTYLETPCVCGYNSEQGKVCHLFHQDEKGGKKYFKLLKDWFALDHITNCHTLGRFSFQCMKQHWGDYDEFMFRYYKFTDYPYQYFAEKCIKKVFLPDFYHADEEWSMSSSLIVSLFLLVLA